MNKSANARRAALLTLLAGSMIGGAAGCSGSGMSLASLNPFSGRADDAPGAAGTLSPQVTEAIAQEQRSGASGQLASFGDKTKAVVAKTTGSVTGLFSRNKNGDDPIPEDDPLRLDNRPKSVDPEVFVANGQLWESTGNFTKAMESYGKALEREANHVPALTNIARLHFRQGNYPQAASFFQKAVERKPEEAELYHDLGLTLNKMGQRESAIETLSRALQMSPGNSRYANNLATVQFEAGNRETALQVLEENNKPAVAHFNMAYLHFKQGHTDAARKHLQETMKFEALAATDTAVKRAVDRSRQMLQQIDGPRGGSPASGPDASVAAQPSRSPSPPQRTSSAPNAPQVLGSSTPAGTSYSSQSTTQPPTAESSVGELKSGVTHSLPSGFTMPAP